MVRAGFRIFRTGGGRLFGALPQQGGIAVLGCLKLAGSEIEECSRLARQLREEGNLFADMHGELIVEQPVGHRGQVAVVHELDHEADVFAHFGRAVYLLQFGHLLDVPPREAVVVQLEQVRNHERGGYQQLVAEHVGAVHLVLDNRIGKVVDEVHLQHAVIAEREVKRPPLAVALHQPVAARTLGRFQVVFRAHVFL